MAPKVLGYWDIRGLGESIRYLLAHAGVPYEDKWYSYGKGPEPSRDEWLAEKYKLDLDFPNLPYLIDGDVRMTQSQAILRYLGRKLSLMPKDEETLRRVDMLEHQVTGRDHSEKAESWLCFYHSWYSYGKGPEPSRDEWLAEKYKLDLDFPNLPYLIDGDVRMTQSQAILRYLGRKLSLMPKDEETLRRVDMLEHQVKGRDHSEKAESWLCFYHSWYSYGKGPEPSRDEWLAEKYKLDLDFPNLPYLIDGDVRMTQSQAILRYLGRKLSLMPKDEETLRRVDMLEHQASDVLWATARLCYDAGYTEDKRRQFLIDGADKLHQFEAYLEKHGPFGAGKNVPYVDFLLYETIQDGRECFVRPRNSECTSNDVDSSGGNVTADIAPPTRR